MTDAAEEGDVGGQSLKCPIGKREWRQTGSIPSRRKTSKFTEARKTREFSLQEMVQSTTNVVCTDDWQLTVG